MKNKFIAMGVACCTVLMFACNIGVENEKDSDSLDRDLEDTTRLEQMIDKADTTLERLGDSAKERYKDIRDGVNDRIDRDTTR